MLPTKIGNYLFAVCSTSIFMLSLSLLTDSDFDSVNRNQFKKFHREQRKNSLQITASIVKEKKKYMQTPQSILRRPSSVFALYLSSVKYESTALHCYLYKSETAQATGKLGPKLQALTGCFLLSALADYESILTFGTASSSQENHTTELYYFCCCLRRQISRSSLIFSAG